MIARYTLPEMGALWTDEHKFATWLVVELAACEAWARIGKIPKAAVTRIKRKAAFDVKRIARLEGRTRHDLVAFVNNVGEHVGADAKYVHYGLTSSDIVDTANAVILKEAGGLILARLDGLMRTVRKLAYRYKRLPQIGRTHGVHAEPITLGLKFALWYDELRRDRRRLIEAIDTISCGKLSGAVGTYGNIDPRVESFVCRKLGLRVSAIATQVVSRDRYAEYLWALAMTATSLEKFAVELRHLQRTEVREVEEGFARGQRGSSAMPHKKNPVSAENICGLARVLRANLSAALENVVLWHERDISHSSAERIILPDSCIGLHYLLARFTRLLDELVVYPVNLRRNLDLHGGLWASGRLLLLLTEALGSRERAYAIVQSAAHQAWHDGGSFKAGIMSHPELRGQIGHKQLAEIFDVKNYLGQVDLIFKRVFA